MKDMLGRVAMRLVATCGAITLAASLAACSNSTLGVTSTEDNTIEVTVQDADAGSSANGDLSVDEGQQMWVRSNLTDESTVSVEVRDASSEDVVAQESYTGVDVGHLNLPAGDYDVWVSPEAGANGSMTIYAE